MKRSGVILPILALIALYSVPAGRAQSRPVFEIASIKPNTSNSGMSVSGYRPGGLYVATNVSVKSMIMESYGVHDFQLVGGPKWIESDGYDVQARAEAGAAAEVNRPNERSRPSSLMLMVQSMLEDRFRLKLHRETRELPVYHLVVGKDGPKLTPAAEPKAECGGRGRPSCPGTSIHSGNDGSIEITATGASLAMFANSIAQMLGRPVEDNTSINGAFDMKLQWTRDDAAVAGDRSNPSIFTAIQEQLGLRLESAKGPVEVIVIDSVEKPTEN